MNSPLSPVKVKLGPNITPLVGMFFMLNWYSPVSGSYALQVVTLVNVAMSNVEMVS